MEETKRNGQAQALLERGGSVRVARWQVGVIVMYGAACVSVLTVIGLMFSRYETAEFRSSVSLYSFLSRLVAPFLIEFSLLQ